MDYQRIYRDFIVDRKARPPIGYSERHHILPRCMGGGDDPSNLINLSAEDHIFAHLLLAKAYGGVLWFPLSVMLRPARQLGIVSRGRRAIRISAIAKREQSRRQTGVKRPDVSAAMSGRAKSDQHRAQLASSRLGWRDSAQTRAKKSAAMNNPEVRSRIFTEARAAKISAQLAGRIRTPEHCAAIAAKAKGRYSGSANPRYDPTIRYFVHKDGRRENLTKFEMAEKHGLNRSCLNYVINGDRESTGGWSLDAETEKVIDAG